MIGSETVTARAHRGARLIVHLRRRLPASSWGFADQVLLSGTNFATTILVARALSPAAFGSYALLYTTLLFTNGLAGTVVTQPHNILGVLRRGDAYRRYTSSTGITQIAITSLTGALILAAALAASSLGSSVAPLLLALAAASVTWMAQEFVRRVLYTEGRLRDAFANDVISYGGQTVAIAALWKLDRLTAATALYGLAATSALAVAAGAWQIRRSFSRSFDREDVQANLNFGKWLTGAFIAYWFASQLYLYLAALILGTAATGTLKAALLVMGPLNVLLVFIDTTTPISLARTFASSGGTAMHAQLRRTAAWVAPVVAAYCLLAALFAGPLLRLFYGQRYANGSAVLALFAVHYFVISLTRTLGAAVRAKQLTRYVFTSNLYAGVVAVTVGWLIIEVGGVRGAVAGMILSAVISGAVLLRGYTSSRQLAPRPRLETS